jgi:hypothetical protein
MIYLEDFEEIVSNLEKRNVELDSYAESLRLVDSVLSQFIIENNYTNILYFQNTFLLEKLLGKDLKDWVDWYIYERPSIISDEPNIIVNDVGYNVTDLQSFMDFARHGLLLQMKPVETFNEKDN